MRKTKIVCTVGPASDDPAVLRQIIGGGMDVARMNFSHGEHTEHKARLTLIRKTAAELGRCVALLLDTKGPEVRLGAVDGVVELKPGQQFTLTTEAVVGDGERASVSYGGLPLDLNAGDPILIDDGLIELRADSIAGNDVVATVVNGGEISSRKSLNFPKTKLNLPAMTDRDRADILFAIENDMDYIAVSFARKAADIDVVRRFLEQSDGAHIKLIAKIENLEGVENFDEILRVSDGVMVARGDLGVEIPVEQIPVVQKDMIRRCYRAGKPVITATQMLDSMIRNPRPTRAEVTDVANAVFDGTSAIMLSGETAVGKYPAEALSTMVRISETAEQSIDYWQQFRVVQGHDDDISITNAIGHATCTTAMDLGAAAVVAVTTGGDTARRISKYRPACPIIAVTTNERVLRQLQLSWGVYPMYEGVVTTTDALFDLAANAAKKSGLVGDGDIVVVTAGVPLGISGTTNMPKVQMIGNILARGRGIGEDAVTAPVYVFGRADDQQMARGSVLVLDAITDEALPLIRMAGGLVLSGEDRDGKAEMLERTLAIPVVVAAKGAADVLKTGTMIRLDARQGLVQCVECD